MKYLLLFCSLSLTFAATSQSHIGRSIKHKIESKAFEKTREIDVYLPYFYDEMRSDSFMVLYIFDGQFDPYFTMTSHMAEYLFGMGEFSPFIAVGIRTENRPKEFTPSPRAGKQEDDWGGDSEKLEEFLAKEVFPLIENTYRTKPLRFGIGHSLGGTFVSDCIFTQNGLFKGVISISPNTVYDNEQLAFNLEKTLSSADKINAFHFMSAGTVGDMENNFRKSSDKLDSIYRVHPRPGFIWKYETYTGLNHSLTPQRSISEGLVAFNNHIRLNENTAMEWLKNDSSTYLDKVKSYYIHLSEWLEYPSAPSVDEINSFGYLAAGVNKWQTALSFFDWGISIYPNDANIYDSKGEALENLGNYVKAYEAYSIAFEKIKLQKNEYEAEAYDWYLETFEKNAKRMKDKL